MVMSFSYFPSEISISKIMQWFWTWSKHSWDQEWSKIYFRVDIYIIHEFDPIATRHYMLRYEFSQNQKCWFENKTEQKILQNWLT